MATDTVFAEAPATAHPEGGAVSFQTEADEASTFGGMADDDAPALQVNPAASMRAVLGAASARAARLHELLTHFAICSREPDAPFSPAELASTLQPLAEEVAKLIDAAQRRVRKGA